MVLGAGGKLDYDWHALECNFKWNYLNSTIEPFRFSCVHLSMHYSLHPWMDGHTRLQTDELLTRRHIILLNTTQSGTIKSLKIQKKKKQWILLRVPDWHGWRYTKFWIWNHILRTTTLHTTITKQIVIKWINHIFSFHFFYGRIDSGTFLVFRKF